VEDRFLFQSWEDGKKRRWGMEEAVRLREPNRKQMILRGEDLDSLIGPEHVARAIWRVLERMELTRFYQPIKAREGSAGRDATPKSCWHCGCMA
jgi:hypothetical protein